MVWEVSAYFTGGLKWLFLDNIPHYSRIENSYCSGCILDGATIRLCSPASAHWRGHGTSHSLCSSGWKLLFLLLSWAHFPPKLRWDLPSGHCMRCFSQPELEENPLPSASQAWWGFMPSAQFATSSATSYSCCGRKHHCAPSTHLAPANASNHALGMQWCRKLLTGEKCAFILAPAAAWLCWSPVRSDGMLCCWIGGWLSSIHLSVWLVLNGIN